MTLAVVILIQCLQSSGSSFSSCWELLLISFGVFLLMCDLLWNKYNSLKRKSRLSWTETGIKEYPITVTSTKTSAHS